ncbi:DUF5009 domain-containing protein [Pirellulales bacterium]|nr:DUF5009 domain-containing protein [Pirellulales bacterium]
MAEENALNTDDRAPANSERLMSLDALRGFDMFWIMGGESVFHAAAKLTGWAWLVWVSSELHHPEWHGFKFYDLIFPLFLFLAGVSMPYSFEKRLSRGDSVGRLQRHVIVRGLVLVLLGWIHAGILEFDWENMRYPSVLGRIGLAYLFAGLIVLHTDLWGRVMWIVGLLVVYWAALKLIPVPGFGAGDLDPGHTLTDYIDRTLIPGRLYKGDRDPEGILGTVPAIATALAGVLTGQLLQNQRLTGYAKTGMMAAAGLVCLSLAWLWSFDFPINKNLWSSSFVLHCAGWSLLFLAAFYLVIDVWKSRWWTLPLVVIGTNSILIYMSLRVIDFGHTTEFFFDGLLGLTGEYRPLFWAIAVLFVRWLFLYFMYRKKVFLRV